MEVKVTLWLVLLSFSWSVTHQQLKNDPEGKNLIGSIRGIVEDAKGVINLGLVNFSTARGLRIKENMKRDHHQQLGQEFKGESHRSPGGPDPDTNNKDAFTQQA